MTTPLLLHVAREDDLQTAERSGRYRAASLDTEGFIHCCYSQQLPGVLQRWFPERDGLVLLSIDTAQLDAELVMENTMGGDELFPHVYGELPLHAIVARQALDTDSLPYEVNVL